MILYSLAELVFKRALSLDSLDNIDPAPDTFSTDAPPIERDEIPLKDCVEELHKISKMIEAIG